MVSAINATLPADNVPANKSDLRANLLAAKQEIEALQARQVPAGGGSGQVLKKTAVTDFAFAWANDETSAGGGITAFPGYAFSSDFLVADSPNDQAVALDSFFDQARISGKHLIFDQGKTTYFTSKTHCFGTRDFVSDGNTDHSDHVLTDIIIDFGGATLKKHSSAYLGDNAIETGQERYSRRAVMKVHKSSGNIFKNGKISNNRDAFSGANANEFKPAFFLSHSSTYNRFENMDFGESWGDGFEMDGLYGANGDEQYWCAHIWFTNCRFNRGGRNGFTVNIGKHIYCINCEFTNTAGHSPEAGVDLESYTDSEQPGFAGLSTDALGSTHRRDIYDIKFIGCLFAGNNRPGMLMASIDMTPEGILAVHDVQLIGCTFRDNGKATTHNHLQVLAFGVVIDGCIFEDLVTGGIDVDPAACIWMNHFSREQYSAVQISDCIFRNNPAADFIMRIGRNTSIGVNTEPVIVDNCIIDGSDMNGDTLITIERGKVIIKNTYMKGRGAGVTAAGVNVMNGVTYCLVRDVEAEDMTTIVTNASPNLKRADFLTRLANVTNTITGTAPSIAPVSNG